MGKLTDKKILIINTGDCWTIDGTITESLDLYYNLKEYGIDSDIALFFNPIRLDHIKKKIACYILPQILPRRSKFIIFAR